MNRIFILVVVAAMVLYSCGSNKLNEKKNTDKTIAIFDGATTTGWHTYGKNIAGAKWEVADNALHLKPYDNKKPGVELFNDLVTDLEYDNFDLQLDWKISDSGNSGIVLYVNENPSIAPFSWNTGIEMQVLDIIGNEDSKSYRHDVGDLYDLVACSAHPANPANEWNHVEIISFNGRLDFYLNKKPILTARLWDDKWKTMIAGSKFKDMPGFGTFKKGHIALQDHGDEVWYKNIMLRKL